MALTLSRRVQEAEHPALELQKIAEAEYSSFSEEFRQLFATEMPDSGFLTDYKQASTLFNTMITQLLLTNPDTETFYKELLNIIDNNTSKRDDVKAVLLASGFLSLLLPYYQAQECISCDEESFRKYSDDQSSRIRMLQFFLKRPFHQKTERASALLSILIADQNPLTRSVLFAHFLEMTIKVRKEPTGTEATGG